MSDTADPADPKTSSTFRVDQASDPAAFIRYLDAAAARASIQHVKQLSYQLLGAREGLHLLDVGSGTGDDACTLASRVRQTGSVTGVDASAVMIAEARQRVSDRGLPIEFVQTDCAALPVPDGSFDGCRAERLLQHVADPAAAVAELVRVARPGRRVVVVDSDHGMVGLHMIDRSLTRRVLDTRCDAIRNGWIGRQLPALLRRGGLVDIGIYPTVSVHTTFDLRGDLQHSVAEAERRHAITADEGRAFLTELEALDNAGEFFLAGVIFTVVGTKP